MTVPSLVFNGIDGATGRYLQEETSATALADFILGQRAGPVGGAPVAEPQVETDPGHLNELKAVHYRISNPSFAPAWDVNPKELSSAGWGLILSYDAPPGLREALKELLQHRQAQAARVRPNRYQEYTGARGFRPTDTKQTFLARNGASPGMPADPDKVPYYLLIAADPEVIPYRFQYQLDVEYAVGRLWFEREGQPDLEAFARYAHSVVEAETRGSLLPRRAVFVGVRNDDDRATQLSATELVAPLVEELRPKVPSGGTDGWKLEVQLGPQARKQDLAQLLGGAATPAVLFTASHGMGFPSGDQLQLNGQGALLCQDWPGPVRWARAIPEDHYFSARDLGDSARPAGMIAFHFACFGAGTPRLDDFAHLRSLGNRPGIAPKAFVARLPQRLLSHPQGGALAVVGHVERAWGTSFLGDGVGRQLQAFQSTLGQLLQGYPVGFATEFFNQRYAALSEQLTMELDEIRYGMARNDMKLAGLWTANNDARSYIILGDPAVRVPQTGTGPWSPVPNTSATRPAPTPINPTPKDSPMISDSQATNNTGSVTPASPAGTTLSPAVTANGQVTMVIPLQIHLQLGGGAAPSAALATAAATDTPAFAVQIDPDYATREGYDPEFLGSGELSVPLPRLSTAQQSDAARIRNPQTGTDPHELKYHHFSVVMNGKRRLAFFTAVNIDGRSASSPPREKDRWSFDPRIGHDEQVGDDLYASNPFDRGHLVRRLDPAWGRSAGAIKLANDDTFHFTNCSPQHERFNQGKNLWAGLEDYLLNRAVDSRKRLTIFTGPVFTADDPVYRGVRIPRRFWKVGVLARPNGRLAAVGFVVSQEELIRPVVFAPVIDVARTFQVSIQEIEQLTGLSFGRLRSLDTGSVDSFAVPAGGPRPLESYSDIVLPGTDRTSVPGTPTSFAPPTPAAAATGPTDQVPGTGLGYYLLAYDENGRERSDHPAGLVSQLVLDALTREPITDVVLFSHGWQGDVPSARTQYANWIATMAANAADRERIREVRANYRPLLVGLHWPSQPWGEEGLGSSLSFAAPADLVGALVEDYARRLGDTATVRQYLRTIAGAAQSGIEPERLPPELTQAYQGLRQELGLATQGVGGAPGAESEVFDPEAVYQEARRTGDSQGAVSFGWFSRDTLLAPLRTLSFWKMKDRGRRIGESAVHPLLVRMMQAAGNRDVRFHLVGHSFGCVVASAAVAGPQGGAALPRPVDSLVLLQGALSLWAYCADIPYARGQAGYFHRLFAEGRVRGPVVTTQSRYDSAVGTWYPRGAQVAGQVAFEVGQLPKYGGLGTFGIQGPGLQIVDERMRPIDGIYQLRPGQVCNVESSAYISQGGGISGAHSDLLHPEVAHLVWAAQTGGG